MQLHTPDDIRAEIVADYLADFRRELTFPGNHKRNAYEDILSVTREDDEVKIEISRQGLYDILPEALFHPIDRFDNLPANEYKERFREELQLQRIEEENARGFFLPFDRFIFALSSAVTRLKASGYGDNSVLAGIICDTLPDKYKSNRFISRALEFTPRCRDIRGDVTLITLMLRKVMAEECLKLEKSDATRIFRDSSPRYNCRLNPDVGAGELYLGNEFEENTVCYDVLYWDDERCDGSFLEFVDELRAFEDFINDYFMGIETSLRFNIFTRTLPVRLSDEMSYNYLNYNTNL